jgi:hypothetical protein
MAATSSTSDPGAQWYWNGEQWLWWNGTQWLEAGVGPTEPESGDSTEPILAVVPNLAIQEGFMSLNSKVFSLVITESRLVFARLHDSLMAELAREERARAGEQGQSGVGQWTAGFNAWDRLDALLRQRGPDRLLTDDPENFALDRATITTVKLTSTGSGHGGSPRLDYLIIRTADKKYKALLAGGEEEARVALAAAGLVAHT